MDAQPDLDAAQPDLDAAPDMPTPDMPTPDMALQDALPPPDPAQDATLDATLPLDAASPDMTAQDATPDAHLAPGFAGFTPAELALIETLADSTLPAPDPTNRFDDDPDAARIGQALFYNRDLSPLNRDCAFCHPPGRGFSGQLSYDGHGGLNFRQAPSLFNLAWLPWFFWDGRADTRWAQARTPLEASDEMGGDRVLLTRVIAGDAELSAAYVSTFGALPPVDDADRFPPRARPDADPDAPLQRAWAAMSPDDRGAIDTVLANAGKALAAYERRLVSFDAPFDAFARALTDRDADALSALSPEAQRGLHLFIGAAGCVACHSGPTFTDGAFHRVGLGPHPRIPLDAGRLEGVSKVVADGFNAAGMHSDAPDGWRASRLAELLPDEDLRGQVRTPTLRNVSVTGPYMHDGRYRDLVAAVTFKVRLDVEPAQGARDPWLVARPFDDAQIADLVAFLTALEGAPPPPELVGRPAFED